MKWTYDPEAGAGYLAMIPGARVATTQVVGVGVHFDFDADGRLVGIEFLGPDAASYSAEWEEGDRKAVSLPPQQCKPYLSTSQMPTYQRSADSSQTNR